MLPMDCTKKLIFWKIHKKPVPDFYKKTLQYFEGIRPAVFYEEEDKAKIISKKINEPIEIVKESIEYLVSNSIIEFY